MRVLLAFFTLFLVSSPPERAFAEPASPAISNVGGTVHGKEAKVRFRLRNAFTPEMVEALKSGIEISFRITVEVKRIHRNWFDVAMGEVRYTQSMRYDVLSKVYRLHRGGENELVPDVQSALERMTRFEVTVPLTGEAERGKPYQADVRARVDRVGLSEPLRSIIFFSSLWDVETDWAHGRLQTP